MAKKIKGLTIPVSLYWTTEKSFVDSDNKRRLSEELQSIIRKKAADILDSEYSLSPGAYFDLSNGTAFLLPSAKSKKSFSYQPATSEMQVKVFLPSSKVKSLGITKKSDLPTTYLFDSTDYLILVFDESFSDSSPIMKKFEEFKAILKSMVDTADKFGVDLYKEKYILENFDAWTSGVRDDIQEFYKQKKQSAQQTGFASLYDMGPVIPILGITFPNTKNINDYRSELAESVPTLGQFMDTLPGLAPGQTARSLSEEESKEFEITRNREVNLNNDDYVAKIGFKKNHFGFTFIKSIPEDAVRFGEAEFEAQFALSANPLSEEELKELEIPPAQAGDAETLANNQLLNPTPKRTQNTIGGEYYPTFVNYIRNMNEIIKEYPAQSDDVYGVDRQVDLMPFLEMYHYPQDIPLKDLEKIGRSFDEAEENYKTAAQVDTENKELHVLNAKIADKLHNQVVNAPFTRQDAADTLKENGGLHGAYGSLMQDGFNFDSLNYEYDVPWLSYPGNSKIRPSHIISDSIVSQISSGKMLSRIKTIKDIENLIVKRLTIRDLLIMALTCADRYGTPNINVLERIDKFLMALGNTRVMPAFRKTTPIGDFWVDFTDQIEGVIKETVEKAIVEFFKQTLVMIASCNIEGVGKQFKKGTADLGNFLTNKDGALLKFADDVLTKSLQKTPNSQNLLRTKNELERIAKIVTTNTTPLELRECLQGNASDAVIAAIAEGLGRELGFNAEKSAVESSLKQMGREDCDLALLDERIEEYALETADTSTELCADFKRQLKEKYSNYDDNLLEEIIGSLPDKDPETALAFDPEFALQPCELLKIPDPAGDFMNQSAYESAFTSVKTKFTFELNAFPIFLLDSGAVRKLNIKTDLVEIDDGTFMPTMTSNKGALEDNSLGLLKEYKKLLDDDTRALVQVVSSDSRQDVKYNAANPKATTLLMENPNIPPVLLKILEDLAAEEPDAVANLSLKKKVNSQDLKNSNIVDGLEYDKEIILRNKVYANLSPVGISQQLISVTGLQSIEIDNLKETLSLRISSPPPNKQLESAIKSFDKDFKYPNVLAASFGLIENAQPTSQAERFSQVATKGWKDILGKIDDSYTSAFRTAMRIHYPVAVDAFAGRFSKKAKYSPFLMSDKLTTMSIFDDPLCPTKQVDLLDLAALTASMETIRKNFICQGMDEQEALQRAIQAGLTITFMRVLIYEKFLPSIFYFSEVGMDNVNKEIYMAFIFSLFCAEIDGGGDDILGIMAQASRDLLSEEEAIDLSNTDALKLLLEKTLYEVSDKVKENIQTTSELDVNAEKFGEVSDVLLRRILDTPVIATYGPVQDDLKNKPLTDDTLKLQGRTVYPEILNVPTFMSVYEDTANQALDTARYLAYTYNGKKNDDLIGILQQASKDKTIDLSSLDAAIALADGAVPPELFNNESGKLVSIEKQLLKNDIDKKYFKEGGFLLEQFIEVQTKKGFSLKDITKDTQVKKINFNLNPLFSNVSAEDALAEGVYGEISEESFDYVDDFLELAGSTPLLSGYVGLDDFYSLTTITQNINEGFSELSQIDKDLHNMLEEWKQFRYRPTAIPKQVLDLNQESEIFKNINSIDESGNINVFKSINSIDDIANTNGNSHVPIGAHRLVAPNTSKAKKGANFSFYIRGDSLNSAKKSTVKYTPNSLLKFDADLDAIDWAKWETLDFADIPAKQSVLYDTVVSLYQIMFKKQGTNLDVFKAELMMRGFVPYTGDTLDTTEQGASLSVQDNNVIVAPAGYSVTDPYLLKAWLNVGYIHKYLRSLKYRVEYESKFTWEIWEDTDYQGQEKIILGGGDIDNPTSTDDCYAVFGKIYSNLSKLFGDQEEQRFHVKQLEYDAENEKWRLSFKSSVIPRLLLYMENLYQEELGLFPIEKDLIEYVKDTDFSNINEASENILSFLNLQYAIPKPEEGTSEMENWQAIFNPVYVTVSLPFGKSLGLSNAATFGEMNNNFVEFDVNTMAQSFKDDELKFSANLVTSYNQVDEILFNLNAEELYWHFDHVLKNITFYGLFTDKSVGANWTKWVSCLNGYNYYPYELTEREIDPTETKGDPDKSKIAWRQFSNPDVEIEFLHQVTKKNKKDKYLNSTSLPLLDYQDKNYDFAKKTFGDGKTTNLHIKPSLLFGKTTIHYDNGEYSNEPEGHPNVTNFQSFNWYTDHGTYGQNVNDGIDDDISEHMAKRYHPDYLHEETARVGFKILKSDAGSNALPEKNVNTTPYTPSQYARIWGIKAKNYSPLLNESYGNMKDWDPNWDGGFFAGAGDAGKAILEGIGNIFGLGGFTDSENPGPRSVLWFLNEFKDIWTEDHGRRKATLDTLLMNMKFYLNQIENYDTLPQSHMNDWTALYVSDAVDNIMLNGPDLGLKSIRIGRTTPVGKQYEINSMGNLDGLDARGLDFDNEIGDVINKFMSKPNYDTLYGQDFELAEDAEYTPIIKIPLVRQGISGHKAGYENFNFPMDKFAVHMQDSAFFATGKSKSAYNNMYNARSLYLYNSTANTYERIDGQQTVAYKLLKHWYDRIEELRDKRAKILNNLRDKIIKFMPASPPGDSYKVQDGDAEVTFPGSGFFADQPHTNYFKPFKAGVRLSYVLPVSEESEDAIPAEMPIPKEVLSSMVQARRVEAGTPGKWYPPLYRKSYEIIERQAREVKVDDDVEVQITNKQVYKIPIAESKIKISEIYGIEDQELPVAFALQLDENNDIKYDYNKVYEAIFKLKEKLLESPDFQVMFNYSLPVEDLSTMSALATYNTVVDKAKPGLGQMFATTKKDLLNTMQAFSLPLSYDSEALIRSYEEEYAFTTTDPIDETGVDAKVIFDASRMILKAVAEISDPTVATAKAIKDVTYLGVKSTIKAGEAAFGGDASSLYDNSTMRYWRSSKAMAPIILSLLPYPIIPAPLLFSMGIVKPFHITPLGMAYLGNSIYEHIEPRDQTLAAGYHSDKDC